MKETFEIGEAVHLKNDVELATKSGMFSIYLKQGTNGFIEDFSESDSKGIMVLISMLMGLKYTESFIKVL